MLDESPDHGSRRRLAVAVVPARGGSKRIPRKNLRPLSGVPLIAWTVSMAVASSVFDRVIVTTDDDEIAEVGRAYGAETPFVRSAQLADDFAPTVDVIADALDRIGQLPDDRAVCCLYPAAVFVQREDLVGAQELLGDAHHPYVAAVSRYAHPIQRAFALDGGLRLEFLEPESAGRRTQDLAPRFHDAGQFYWGPAAAWQARLPILDNARGFELPTDRACDIDNESDWAVAQALHSQYIQGRDMGDVEP